MTTLHDVLEQNFIAYQKAHNYHWNVTGPLFVQYHGFFGDYYGDVYAQMDIIAEHIRAGGELVPFSGAKANVVKGSADEMVRDLAASNKSLRESFIAAFKACKDEGTKNYLADRIDQHAKWQWQLDAMVGAAVEKKVFEHVTINNLEVLKENGLYAGVVVEGKEVLLQTPVDTFSMLISEIGKADVSTD